MSEENDRPGSPFVWGLTPGATSDDPAATEPAAQASSLDDGAGVPTQAMAVIAPPQAPTPPAAPEWSANLAPVDPNARWFSEPLDSALDGITEVLDAELVGLPTPAGEGVGASALDDLFGATQFQDFGSESLIAPLPPRPSGSATRHPPGPGAALPRTQKILIAVAGVLLAALVLVGLFTVGTRMSGLIAAPIVTPSATPSPTAAPAVGPVASGTYRWDQLRGGECIEPWQSAWQDNYVVVPCTAPHRAQMVFRGLFDDAIVSAYPGFDALQKRINVLCTAPAVIDYAAARGSADIQLSASFAIDSAQWAAGDHYYYCFANRAGGGELTTSIAVAKG